MFSVGLFFVANKSDDCFDAKKWCDHCLAAIGSGRGGGRADYCAASIPIPADSSHDSLLELITQTATAFAALHLQ